MIESYIQKVIFVDAPFLESLKQKSITEFKAFNETELDTKIIKLPLQSEDVDKLVKHAHPSEIRPGNIIVKPDYSDKFMSVDSFAASHAERKYRLWVLLCVALGARRVSVTNIEEVSLEMEDMSSTSAQVDATSPVAKGEASFKSVQSGQNDDARKSIMNIKVEASGGDPDVAAAERILSEHGLHNDDMFRRMYDMRCLKNNSVSKQDFSLDLSTDVKRVFDSSLKAKITAMSKLYGGSAGFEKVRNSIEKGRSALKLTVSVEF